MMINLCSYEDERIKLVGKALGSLNESDSNVVAKFVVGGDTLNIPRSMKILCPFLSDLIGSLPLNSEELIIIIPDCSSTSLRHLIELLTTGFTESCTDLEAVVEVANILKIDIKNVVPGYGRCDSLEVDLDLEDGEIVDSDESLSQEPHSEQAKKFGSIKVAAFSKSFISVPNIISDNFEELASLSASNTEALSSSTSNSALDKLCAPTSNKLFAPTSNKEQLSGASTDSDLLFAPTNNNSLLYELASCNSPLFAPTNNNSPLFAPTSNNRQLFAPTSNTRSLFAPTSNNRSLFAPTSNNNQLVAPTTNNSQLVAPTSYNNPLFAQTSNNNPLYAPISSSNNPFFAPKSNSKAKKLPTSYDKLFSSFRNLITESPLGKDEKKASFHCQECNRVFANKDGLRLHMKNSKKHRVNKNTISLSKVNLASKPVKAKKMVTRSISVNKPGSENWMFICEMCELRKFKKQLDLNNHKQVVHNWCPGCFSSFKSQESLKSHRKECNLPLLSK